MTHIVEAVASEGFAVVQGFFRELLNHWGTDPETSVKVDAGDDVPPVRQAHLKLAPLARIAGTIYNSAMRHPIRLLQGCYEASFAHIEARASGGVLNFFHVLRVNSDLYLVTWGEEKFSLDVTVDRASGRILSGRFGENYLHGLRRFCTSLLDCSVTSEPIATTRRVELRATDLAPMQDH